MEKEHMTDEVAYDTVLEKKIYTETLIAVVNKLNDIYESTNKAEEEKKRKINEKTNKEKRKKQIIEIKNKNGERIVYGEKLSKRERMVTNEKKQTNIEKSHITEKKSKMIKETSSGLVKNEQRKPGRRNKYALAKAAEKRNKMKANKEGKKKNEFKAESKKVEEKKSITRKKGKKFKNRK
ncbi:hypothetical protein TCON_1847 [Astathelohania contejeani]|uniref:Uncharacterized protein n=1 Tax=Astathelohania contejeani TaxID=164912 RepID=A0ABQ7HXQ4_9MICR|nr:hypothetical protein TCON_1847 [Thelohania contejeani]